jgi:hypothetical protein
MFAPNGAVATGTYTPIPFTSVYRNGIGFTLDGPGTNIALQPNSLYYVSFAFRINISPATAAITDSELFVSLNGAPQYINTTGERSGTGTFNFYTSESSGMIQTGPALPQNLSVSAVYKFANPTTASAVFVPTRSNLSIFQIM